MATLLVLSLGSAVVGPPASATQEAPPAPPTAAVVGGPRRAARPLRPRLDGDADVSQAIADLEARPDVLYAEPNYRVEADAVPNDSRFGELWGLHNTGQPAGNQVGTPDADIDAPEAWNTTTGSANVTVAVVDGGVAYDHPDLAPNMWVNADEVAGNGVDDDGNGFVDDRRGWDFVGDRGGPLCPSSPTVSGVVEVHRPLVEFLRQERADRLAAEGLFADDPDGMAAAWDRIQEIWAATVARARLLPEPMLDERVDGEWSFIETLRHLVFVSDAWVGEVVEEGADPYHPWGLPPDFRADAAGELGLDVDARPRLDEVMDVRRGRAQEVGRVVAGLTPEALRRTCAPRDGMFTVVGALQTVLFEEWAHHRYATRDLASLERSG